MKKQVVIIHPTRTVLCSEEQFMMVHPGCTINESINDFIDDMKCESKHPVVIVQGPRSIERIIRL